MLSVIFWFIVYANIAFAILVAWFAPFFLIGAIADRLASPQNGRPAPTLFWKNKVTSWINRRVTDLEKKA